MGWPRGKPRKGHINKDGSPHRPFGAGAYAGVQVEADPTSASDYVPPLHGVVGTGPISAPCPKCGYAYADGGYCPDCGWHKAISLLPYGTAVGRRF